MKLLMCIDDTDNLDSIGTGEMLENICEELEAKGLASGGFVTRHQLYIHEDIAYTSHNSSMCCELKTDDFEGTLECARRYLEEHAAEGSDPGICILKMNMIKCRDDKKKIDSEKIGPLMDFGRRAQKEVIQKQEAYELAEKYEGILWLSEHGGTGIGVIGALAGIGLRLTGSDGKIKGKLKPAEGGEVLSVREFCERFNVERVIAEDAAELAPDEKLIFEEATKSFLIDNKVTVVARRREDAYEPVPHKKKKKEGVCEFFVRDYEEECTEEKTDSCVNCRYRRWIEGGFECKR